MSAAIGAFSREREPDILASRDRWELTRRVFARVAALGLHVLLFLCISLTPVVHTPPKEPPTIPIELVIEPPQAQKRAPRPPPSTPPSEQPQPKVPPGTQPEIPHVESGGNPSLKSGAPAATKPVTPQEQPQPQPQAATAAPAESPAPAAEAKPTTEPPAPAPALPLVQAPLPIAPPAQATATTKPPPPKAAKEETPRPPTPAATAPHPATSPQVASLPPTTAQPKPPTNAPPGPATSELAAPDWSEGERRGEGGGDRYLNALRDAIVSKILYPDSAHGTGGIVRYEIEMNRQGFMLKVAIVQSSGLPSLDRAGLDAIENTMPFQPLPIRIQGNRVYIRATLYIGPQGARSP